MFFEGSSYTDRSQIPGCAAVGGCTASPGQAASPAHGCPGPPRNNSIVFCCYPSPNCRGDLSQEGQTPQNQHPGLSDSDLADVLRAPVSLFPSLAMTYGNLPLETESCEPSSSTVANPQPRDKNTHPQIPFSAQRDHRAASFLYTPRNPEPFPKATGISLAADDPQRTGEARRALHGPPRTAAPPRARHLPLPAAVPPSSSRLPKRRVPRG